jgi:hypothetical protein
MGRALGSGRRRGWMGLDGPWVPMAVPNFSTATRPHGGGSLQRPLDRSGFCSGFDTDPETVCRLFDPAASQNGRFSPSFAERVTPSGTVSNDVGSALCAHASGQGECTSSRRRGMTGYCKLYGYLSSNPGWPTPGLSARV